MQPKKSLGQNFLRDGAVVDKILSAVLPQVGEVIVEVGPGEGVLTQRLAESGAKVIAIELDDRLIPLLQEKFKKYQNVKIVHKDILDVSMAEILTIYDSQPIAYRIIGNLPYYITSAIVRKFLESDCVPSEMFFMVQKEVGERICSRPGKMSILAVAVQYYANPELLFGVPKESFDPVPKVESAFIKITNNQQSITNNRIGEKKNYDVPFDSKEFFRVVKIGFSARRKTLANNLVNGFHLDKSIVKKLLEDADVSVSARAQDLTVKEWKMLGKQIQGLLKNEI